MSCILVSLVVHAAINQEWLIIWVCLLWKIKLWSSQSSWIDWEFRSHFTFQEILNESFFMSYQHWNPTLMTHDFNLVCTASQVCILLYAFQLQFRSYWSEHRPLGHRWQSEVHLETWVSLPWQILWLHGGVGMEDRVSIPPMRCLPAFVTLTPAFPYFAVSLGKHFSRRGFLVF